MTAVWLTQVNNAGPAEIIGVFSSPERAKKACQDQANAYFGAARTPALKWLGNDGHWSASYHHPGSGMQLFQVTRYEVDQEVLTW